MNEEQKVIVSIKIQDLERHQMNLVFEINRLNDELDAARDSLARTDKYIAALKEGLK